MAGYALIGYPIAQSLAPFFHNTCFDLEDSSSRYSRWSTSRLTPKVLDWLKSDDCLGAAVTMPLKAATLPHLDEITPEAGLTGAVNTVVKVRRAKAGSRLVGTNTDYLGIVSSLRTAILLQHPPSSDTKTNNTSSAQTFPPGQLSAAVIGGGATTRSAILALHRLGLGPIFLVNRDEDEVRATMHWFGGTELVSKGGLSLLHVERVDEVEEYLGLAGSFAPLGIVVGAIPAILPKTPAERTVYTIATQLFTSSFSSDLPNLRSESSSALTSATPAFLPLPQKPIFLDMAYYPRPTPLTQIARALGWSTIDGMQAMIEQGLAQQRMWLVGSAAAEVGMMAGVLKEATEREVRRRLLEIEPVRVEGMEVDRADEV